MDTGDVVPLIELLDDNIDDLEEALSPLLKNALSDKAGKLPLLDKAQLYVLVTYAIESILFSYLRLNGVNARKHPVFRELIRVKQYFEKIKNIEAVSSEKGPKIIDKAAAGRFIKHALAGNKQYDINQAEPNGKTKVEAHIKFDQVSKKRKIEDDQDAALPNPVSLTSSSESEQSTTRDTAHDHAAQPGMKKGRRQRGKQLKRMGKKQQSQATGDKPDFEDTQISPTINSAREEVTLKQRA